MVRLFILSIILSSFISLARAETVYWAGVGFSNYGDSVAEQQKNFPFPALYSDAIPVRWANPSMCWPEKG